MLRSRRARCLHRERCSDERLGRRAALVRLLGGLAVLPGCDPLLPDYLPPPADLGSFPYNPLVFHLDLAVLAYQLHGQSLVWPIDPFYEERGADRDVVMARVRDWVREQADLQAGVSSLTTYRGPGVLGGFPDNPTHDPILYSYGRLHPVSRTIMNAASVWTEYLTPRAITERIVEVWVSYRQSGGAEDDVLVERVPPGRDDADPDASDVLVAFEGGTGDKGEPGQPASQSLMGFVLLRRTTGARYDVHVSFRGSRSGSAVRAATAALSTELATGNPDWITDLGFRTALTPDISKVGGVARGFSHSMRSILPAAMLALRKVAEIAGGAPSSIFVTGHSLGAALAQHFASAVLAGEEYGPSGAGPAMPETLAAWPWRNLKLITFAAPRAGDRQWADALTTSHLDATFFDESPVVPFDPDARYVTDPEIVERLNDPDRPAAFRVLVSTDPVTTDTLGGGAHVGTSVYVNGDLLTGWVGIPSFQGHEPEVIRRFMTDAMADLRTPYRSWHYRALEELVPDRDDSQAGSRQELEKLADGLLAYYADRDVWFDSASFERDLAILLAFG
jgi:hypothetical protein